MAADEHEVFLDQRVSLSDRVLAQEVAGETVLLDMASEQYFGLDEVGTRIWQLLRDGGDLRETFEIMLSEYDVEPDRLAADLRALVEEAVTEGLLTLAPSGARS